MGIPFTQKYPLNILHQSLRTGNQTLLFQFLSSFRSKLFCINCKSLMASTADQIKLVSRLYFKSDLSSFNLYDLRLYTNLNSRRSWRQMAYIDMSSDALLEWPVYVWINSLNASPFD